MDARAAERATRMLVAVLNGKTYAAVGRGEGIGRSAVEKQVKYLDRQLRRAVGVQGAPREGAILVGKMRALRAAYLDALPRYRPQEDTRRIAQVLSDSDMAQVADAIRGQSSCPRRDLALFYVLFATAARPIEIARLTVADYLNPDGSIKVESVIRAGIAFNGICRPVFFVGEKANAAVKAYLDERFRKGFGLKRANTYGGLDPSSRLFLTDRGRAMQIRVYEVGTRKHHTCAGIRAIYDRLFERAGLAGASALSARRTMAGKLQGKGCEIARIGEVLGLKKQSSVRELLPAGTLPLLEMVRGVVT